MRNVYYLNLQYAWKELQNDREMVLEAVKAGSRYFQGPSPLRYASEELKLSGEITDPSSIFVGKVKIFALIKVSNFLKFSRQINIFKQILS